MQPSASSYITAPPRSSVAIQLCAVQERSDRDERRASAGKRRRHWRTSTTSVPEARSNAKLRRPEFQGGTIERPVTRFGISIAIVSVVRSNRFETGRSRGGSRFKVERSEEARPERNTFGVLVVGCSGLAFFRFTPAVPQKVFRTGKPSGENLVS